MGINNLIRRKERGVKKGKTEAVGVRRRWQDLWKTMERTSKWKKRMTNGQIWEDKGEILVSSISNYNVQEVSRF